MGGSGIEPWSDEPTTTYGPPKGYVMPSDNISVFDSLLGNQKTYIAAGLGICFDVLSAFHVYTLTPEQITAVNGVFVLAAAIFLRLGVRKAQKAAQGAQAAVEKSQ